MSRLVCLCSYVEEKEIINALRKGAVSTSEIQLYTGAGRSCGRCLPEIDGLVEQYLKKKPKEQQQRLDFGF